MKGEIIDLKLGPCPACKSELALAEIIKVKRIYGELDQKSGTFPFHHEIKSKGHVCTKCRIKLDLPPAYYPNELERLEVLAYRVLAQKTSYFVLEDQYSLDGGIDGPTRTIKKNTIVYLVPELKGCSKNTINDLPRKTVKVTEKPVPSYIQIEANVSELAERL